jgi:hypothetical protein
MLTFAKSDQPRLNATAPTLPSCRGFAQIYAIKMNSMNTRPRPEQVVVGGDA